MKKLASNIGIRAGKQPIMLYQSNNHPLLLCTTTLLHLISFVLKIVYISFIQKWSSERQIVVIS